MSPAPPSPPDPIVGARPPAGGRPRLWVLRLTLLSLVTLLLLGALDLLLLLRPEVFGEQRANEIFSRYDTRPGGIYVREKRTRMRFMWPDFTTENYWNGYRWQHATDARGFRNPPGTPADVLLLGDSLIYGHGVEETETVAHFLRTEHAIGAYNMGRQGAALYDEYVLLRTFLPELSPQSVVLFVFLNDFDDLEVYRTAGEIAAMPEIDRLDYPGVREWNRRLPGALPQPAAALALAPAVAAPGALGRQELRSLAFTTPAWAGRPALSRAPSRPRPPGAPRDLLLPDPGRSRGAQSCARHRPAHRLPRRGRRLEDVRRGSGDRRRPGARRRRRERLALLRQP